MSTTLSREGRSTVLRACAWVLVYVVIAIAALGANPFKGQTVGPFDLLASAPGWNPAGEPVQIRHRERSDIVDALLPAWLESRRQLRDGKLPLWNPLPAGGSPAMFDASNAQLTPGFWLFALAPDPAFGFYLSVLSCLVIAGLGMHAFVARYCAAPASLFAGVSYMLCGFLAAWLYWQHTHTAIWIPWLLLAVDHYAKHNSLAALPGVAVASALMLLGGFPFVAAIGIGVAFVHAWVVASRRGGFAAHRAALGVLGGIALGAMLCAIPLLGMASGLSEVDLGYRRGGSGLSVEDAGFLLGPWYTDPPRVESNMYVGTLALLLAPLGVVAALRQRHTAVAWSALAYVVVGFVLVFGVLPLSIGRHLPVLSNNPWQRAILLLDLGLILLAAVGLNWTLGRISWRRVALLGSFLVVGLQFADLRAQFRKFNGPTPARYFYPETQALAYVRDRLEPFQYVAVDARAYLVSGTQGGEGLADWFAHSFRSKALHDLLADMAQNPFASPTATAMDIRRYRWHSDLLDALAICYALYPNDSVILPTLVASRGTVRQALPPINRVLLVQRVSLEEPLTISAIGLRLATYRATDLDGEVVLTVRPEATGLPVAVVSLEGEAIRDNQLAVFHFSRALDLTAGSYRLELRYTPGARQRNLTAWLYTDGAGHVLRDGESISGSLDYVFYGVSEEGLVPLFQDRAITAARNRDCATGPYWTRSLNDPAETMAASRVALSRYEPEAFALRVRAPEEGYIIVPMRMQRGWTAKLEGRPIEISRAYGVLPAVKVPQGMHSVKFRYRPPFWLLGMGISLVGLASIAGLLRAGKRRQAGSAAERP